MHQKINREKERGARLKQKVQILGSLNTADEVWMQNGELHSNVTPSVIQKEERRHKGIIQA